MLGIIYALVFSQIFETNASSPREVNEVLKIMLIMGDACLGIRPPLSHAPGVITMDALVICCPQTKRGESCARVSAAAPGGISACNDHPPCLVVSPLDF